MSDPDAPMKGMDALLYMIFNPQLHSMLDDFASAESFVVLVVDPDTLYRTYVGPFESHEKAYAYRARVEADLNKQPMTGYQPFEVTVMPMYAPEVENDG